jgi:hypothetical protein
MADSGVVCCHRSPWVDRLDGTRAVHYDGVRGVASVAGRDGTRVVTYDGVRGITSAVGRDGAGTVPYQAFDLARGIRPRALGASIGRPMPGGNIVP